MTLWHSFDVSASLRTTRLIAFKTVLLTSVLLVPCAQAETASEITPHTFEPSLQGRGGGIVIPQDAGSKAPAGSENLSVHIEAVHIEGGLTALANQEQAISAKLSGHVVTAAALFDAASELERAYAAAGYVLVRVVLPAQNLVDGATLRLVVVDGYIERIDTDKLPANIRSRIQAILAPLVSSKGVGQHGLTLRQIERRLLLAGDLPGTVLRSTLSPGSVPGASVLIIEARYKPATGFIAADNTLSRSLERYATTLGVDLNSPTGHGELLYLRTGGQPWAGGESGFFDANPRNRLLAAGLTIPLGVDGLTFNLEATDARATPQASSGSLGLTSDFKRYSARLRYPVIRSRDLILNAETDFDAQEERVTVISPVVTDLSLDRLRIVRAGGDFNWFLPGNGTLSSRLFGSFGIDGLGARSAPPSGSSDVPLSRQGVKPDFQKLEVSVSYTQPLTDHLILDLRTRAQSSFNQPLPRSEQIGLAGPGGLSTFDSGLIQGDAGFVARGETQFPFVSAFTLPFVIPAWPAQQGTVLAESDNTSGTAVLSPYLFGAYGSVYLQDPTVLENAITRGKSYGVGLRLGGAGQASFTALNFNLEYGRYELSSGFGSGSASSNGDRLSFTTSFQF